MNHEIADIKYDYSIACNVARLVPRDASPNISL